MSLARLTRTRWRERGKDAGQVAQAISRFKEVVAKLVSADPKDHFVVIEDFNVNRLVGLGQIHPQPEIEWWFA